VVDARLSSENEICDSLSFGGGLRALALAGLLPPQRPGEDQMLAETPFQLVDVDDDHAKLIAFGMIFIVWKRETLAAPYQRFMALVTELGEQHPEGIGVLQLVEVTAVPPDENVRRLFREAMLVCDEYVKHYSVVHEGSGFKAATFRAIVTSAVFLRRPKFPHIVSSSLAHATRWHEEQLRKLGKPQGARDLLRQVQFLRESLAKR
jgi:hypothetical protein